MAIAGEALSMHFNVSSSAFRLEYVVPANTSLDERAATEIFVWPERYPGGATVTAKADIGSMRIEYNGTGSLVSIYRNETYPVDVRVIVSIDSKKDEA
ncbi:hypothetical protein Ctob_005831 [Chrysochromulina tobinii]|uniref:Glycoside hydrolase family 5 C-terminal domain-containing protein n=1 Tax=Chrysochromulina tobinii TaxID=1460289 RepID=A0A0M0JIY6_9EUKA|nr:hypothetical protein Ctob_005831 [Chrysochromulina tobinii]|eukprot:KOO26556.1 hypothetical protein Ctob_005831 [Chrysochromulina sp. CCMP291]